MLVAKVISAIVIITVLVLVTRALARLCHTIERDGVRWAVYGAGVFVLGMVYNASFDVFVFDRHVNVVAALFFSLVAVMIAIPIIVIIDITGRKREKQRTDQGGAAGAVQRAPTPAEQETGDASAAGRGPAPEGSGALGEPTAGLVGPPRTVADARANEGATEEGRAGSERGGATSARGAEAQATSDQEDGGHQ